MSLSSRDFMNKKQGGQGGGWVKAVIRKKSLVEYKDMVGAIKAGVLKGDFIFSNDSNDSNDSWSVK